MEGEESHNRSASASRRKSRRISRSSIKVVPKRYDIMKEYREGFDLRRSRRTDLLIKGREEEVYFCLKREFTIPRNECEGEEDEQGDNKRDHDVTSLSTNNNTGSRQQPAPVSAKSTVISQAPILQLKAKVHQLRSSSMDCVSPQKKKGTAEITVDFSPRKGSPRIIADKRLSFMEEIIGITGIKKAAQEAQAQAAEALRSNPQQASCSDVLATLNRDLMAASLGADQEWSTLCSSETLTAAATESEQPKRLRLRRAPGRTCSDDAIRRKPPLRSRSRELAMPVRAKSSDDLFLMAFLAKGSNYNNSRVAGARQNEIVPKEQTIPSTASIEQLRLSSSAEPIQGDEDKNSTARVLARKERRQQKELEGESLQLMLNDLKRVNICLLRRCKDENGGMTADGSARTMMMPVAEPQLCRSQSDEQKATAKDDGTLLDGSSHHRPTPILKTSAYEGIQSPKKVIHADRRRDGNRADAHVSSMEAAAMVRKPTLSRAASTLVAPPRHARPTIQSFASSRVPTNTNGIKNNVGLIVFDERQGAAKSNSGSVEQTRDVPQSRVSAAPEMHLSFDWVPPHQTAFGQMTTGLLLPQVARPGVQRFSSLRTETPSTDYIGTFKIVGLIKEEEEPSPDAIVSPDVSVPQKSRLKPLVRAMSIMGGRSKALRHEQVSLATEKALDAKRNVQAASDPSDQPCGACQEATTMESTLSNGPRTRGSKLLSKFGSTRCVATKSAPPSQRYSNKAVLIEDRSGLSPKTVCEQATVAESCPSVSPEKRRGGLLRYVSSRFERK